MRGHPDGLLLVVELQLLTGDELTAKRTAGQHQTVLQPEGAQKVEDVFGDIHVVLDFAFVKLVGWREVRDTP